MVKTKKTVSTEQVRKSARLQLKPPLPAVEKKRAPAKKGPKAKKAKGGENANAKTEDPKVEATEAN